LEPITAYHWLVLILAACGWLFDCMGQRIFVLAREPALRELLGTGATDDAVRSWGGMATLLLMVGWATGGIIFGTMSDRYGRVKAMIATLLAYTVFSGLSGFAHSAMEFLVYRFLFGLGVGGMFGAATALVAESVPGRFRPVALGIMQTLSAGGNIVGSALSLRINPAQENYWGHFSGWQVLFFAGLCPVALALPMGLLLREPESWRRAKSEAAARGTGKSVGAFGDLFINPRWRYNMLVGVGLGVAGMVGLWAIAFYSPELITTALRHQPLQVSDIKQPTLLCADLSEVKNPAVSLVRARIAPAVLSEIEGVQRSEVRDQKSEVRDQRPEGAAEKETVSAETIAALVRELNGVIQGGSVYDAEAFKGVKLRKATRNLAQRVQKQGAPEEVAFLNRQLVEQLFPQAIEPLQRTIDKTKSAGTLLQDVGALLGMFTFTLAAAYLGRRTAFLGSFLLCLAVVSFVFYSLRTATDAYWMLPLVGFATLSCFAGYSIYFPELFPTRLRGTGVGLCYNTVRYLAAPFPFLLGWLSTLMPFRTVAISLSAIYFLGIAALFWAPETRGKPLPED
jgi:MFS family permease